MKAINKDKIPDINLKNNFDILCQEFDGGSFYGLEYILDDFFQSTTVKPSVPTSPSVDWFGLYSQWASEYPTVIKLKEVWSNQNFQKLSCKTISIKIKDFLLKYKNGIQKRSK